MLVLRPVAGIPEEVIALLPRREGSAVDVERIAHKAHLRRRVANHLLALALTWLFIFVIYAVTIKIGFSLLDHNIEESFFCPWDGFWAYYGIGMIVATGLLPLFVVDFLMDDIESYTREKALLLEFRRARGVDVTTRR